MKTARLAAISGALVLLATAAPAAEQPRLVLLVAVDQLRSDRLTADLPGGFGRLVREGRVFSEGALEHAGTATCPGMVTMLHGRHPGSVGVPGNSFVDRITGEHVYCVADRSEDASLLKSGAEPPLGAGESAAAPGRAAQGRSPRMIRSEALGDWMKRARPAAKVFSLSQKDRSAIALGGRRPDAAYWLERAGSGFTTSGYYLPELPDWVRVFDTDEVLFAGLPESWEHAAPPDTVRPDDYEGESERYGLASPHPVRSPDRRETLEQVNATPYSDQMTLRFARALIENEGLGSGPGPDLLAISLSATDTVGHLSGPGSHEAYDALRRVDAAFGEFLDFVEDRLGAGRVLVALTADHGVLPLPEWLEETGRGQCPEDGGRLSYRRLVFGVGLRLHWHLGPLLSWPAPWIIPGGSGLVVNPVLARERGVEVERVVEIVERYLESQDGIERVWTRDEIRDGTGPEEFVTLYRNSFDEDRSGDLMLQLEPGCLLSMWPSGTTHGSPYAYDREVPIVFWGPGVEAGAVRGRAATVDIAPTLARAIGLTPPADLDGRPLDLR